MRYAVSLIAEVNKVHSTALPKLVKLVVYTDADNEQHACERVGQGIEMAIVSWVPAHHPGLGD